MDHNTAFFGVYDGHGGKEVRARRLDRSRAKKI
jgi:hypothetical protein